MWEPGRVRGRRTRPWYPAYSLYREQPSDLRYTAAIAEAWEVFSAHPHPLDDPSYWVHIVETDEMNEILRQDRHELTAEALSPILCGAFLTWGDWPSLAYFMPRMLELYAEHRIDDDLFDKLLLASHPERGYVKEPVTPAERRSIFRVVSAVADVEMEYPFPCMDWTRVYEALCFLAGFDAPIAALLERWKALPHPVARGRVGALVADHALHYEPEAGTVRLNLFHFPHLAILPENRSAMEELASPEFVAAYLAEHAGDAALFGSDYETAFDWATAVLRQRARADGAARRE
jgi:hypothetical protein